MTTRFGELVKQVASLREVVAKGVIPGALVCGMVVSGMALAQAETMDAPFQPRTVSAQSQNERFGELQVELDKVALNYYQGAIRAMAQADLSKMPPARAMGVLQGMARDTLANGPGRGDLTSGPSNVPGLEAVLGFFSQFKADDDARSVQARAVEVAKLAGADLNTFSFGSIVDELVKANAVHREALMEIEKSANDVRGVTLEDLAALASDGSFDRHATEASLLRHMVGYAIVSEDVPEQDREAILVEFNRNVAMRAGLAAIEEKISSEGTWIDRGWIRKTSSRALERDEGFGPAQTAPAP